MLSDLIGVEDVQLGSDETPAGWVLVICINYSRVEGFNIAPIKPWQFSFSKAGTYSTCGNFNEERRDWPKDCYCFTAINPLVHLAISRKTGAAVLARSITRQQHLLN